MRGITKRYPGVVANDGIDLDVRPGEIHALLGENGAGKTTLMNILYGLAVPDEGEILLDGKPVKIAGPSDAIARGISMVHQHFMLVPVLTVAENIILGAETMANPRLPRPRRGRRRIRELAERFGFEIDPDAKVATPVGGLAAARRDPQGALSRRAHPRPRRADGGADAAGDRGDLRRSCVAWPPSGHSIIFISHKLYEVLEIADRITVIRRGKVVGSGCPARPTRTTWPT